MGKILSQSGIALADQYQIEGSIVGVESLQTDDVSLVHEMGAAMMSERMKQIQVLMEPTAPTQNTNFSLSSGGVADCPNRVLHAAVYIPAANAGDITSCVLSIEDGRTGIQSVFFEFNDAQDDEGAIRWDDGTGSADMLTLRGRHTLPSLMIRPNIGTAMPVIRFQGSTSGFGAGTVAIQALIHLVRPAQLVPQPGQASSHGLPLPSW